MMSRNKLVVAVLLSIVCVSWAQADNIYVSNFTNNTIEVFNSAGQGGLFASTGLSGPAGLAFSGGNLYVANYSNNTIEVFNSAGHGSVFASSGLSEPLGLAFYGGNLYVANHGNNTIEEFNSAGHGSVFASTGLSGPVGLAFDANGNLYVANAFNNTIEKFNSSGGGTAFATVGSSDNVLAGLAVDTSGNLYASSIGLTIEPPSVTAIVKLTPTGVESTFAAGSGMNEPEGLAFDSSGNLYVANSGNNTLEKFNASGNGLVFASSGLYSPVGIATQTVPEPATWALVALGTAAFFGRRGTP